MGYGQAPGDAGGGRTAFRNAEKQYKLYTERNPRSGRGGKGSRKAKQEVDLSNVIDLNRIENDREYAEERGAQRLEDVRDWPTYVLQSHPGMVQPHLTIKAGFTIWIAASSHKWWPSLKRTYHLQSHR